MNTLLLFSSTFILVFALGLQSQLANNGHYIAAFMNSFVIGLGQIGALQVVHAHSTLDYAAYVTGGPIAIVCSMLFFRRYIRRGVSVSKADLPTVSASTEARQA
jgi:hypothetical protein